MLRISDRQTSSKILKTPSSIRPGNTLGNNELGLFDRSPFVLLPLLGIGTQSLTCGSVCYWPHGPVIAEKLIAANLPTRQDSLSAEIWNVALQKVGKVFKKMHLGNCRNHEPRILGQRHDQTLVKLVLKLPSDTKYYL